MANVLLEKKELKSTYADVLSKKALGYVKKQLHDKEYYDAYSMICTFVHRCIHKSQYVQALDLCHDFGLEFIKHERFDLACELGDLIITMLMEASLSVTQQRIQYILDIFEPFPKHCEISRHRFIEHALKWAIQNAGPESPFVKQLHYAAGISYMKEKNFALAQGHLIFCGDGELLGSVVAQWFKEGYYSERPLFVLRLILLLLAKGDIKTAEETFYSKALKIDLEQSDIPPAIQFAYLLLEACKEKNLQLFDVLTSKYSLVIRRDKLFEDLIHIINKKVMEREPIKKNNNFLNLFSSLFGNINPTLQTS